MSHTPTVSVIMAAYNGAGLIRETLDTLKAQSFTDFEAIVVDDHSTDDTLAVLKAYDAPWLRVLQTPENGGPVVARNFGVAHARGHYIAGLDHDDLCKPDRFARQVAFLDANPDAVMVATAADVLEENGAIVPSRLPPVTTPMLLDWLIRVMNPFVWSTVMLRGDVARCLEPFTRPDYRYAEDFDLYHRLRPHGKLARIDQPLLVYRNHSGGASQRHAETMTAQSTRILADCYRPVLGEGAKQAARLVVTHVMRRQPVSDRATLMALGEVLHLLQDDFIATAKPDAESLSLIKWETARLWARIGQEALRSGAIKLSDTLAVRPDHMGLGYAGLDDLAKSTLIGAVKRARR